MIIKRIHFIDWLRVLAVLLLFPFHTSRVFNAGEAFYVKAAQTSVFLNYAIGFVNRWHMPLLFLLAGCSTYFALRKRTGPQYARERVKRLLVPFVFGFFVLVPPQTWLGARFNSGYSGSFSSYITSGAFLTFNVRDGGDYWGGIGFAHLWFIIFLFAISLFALPLLLRARRREGQAAARFCRLLAQPHGALVAAFLLLLGEALPGLFGLDFFFFLVLFVLGYVVMASPEFMDAAAKWRIQYLIFGVAAFVSSWMLRPVVEGYPDPSLPLAAWAYIGDLATWCMIAGLLGLGKRYLDWTSPTLAYHAESSYPVYILHQTVIVILAWYVVDLPVSWPLQWILLLVGSVAVTFGLYEVVRRVRALRPLFGMKPAAPSPADNAERGA